MANKKLLELLKNRENLDSDELRKLLKEKAYSQNIRKLLSDQEGDSIHSIYTYDWSPENPEFDKYEDIVELSKISLDKNKDNKKTKKKKKTVEESSPEDHRVLDVKETTESVSNFNKTEETSKAQTVKPGLEKFEIADKQEAELDAFTRWLNGLDSAKSTEQTKLAKTISKEKSGKKKKKKKKKDKSDPKHIKSKIEDSVKDKEEIATPLLAKLYEEQEYYDKAIEVYEKLSLKFPEKSSFFAAQIQKLKDKI